jgi:hypothetical protein
LHTDSKLNFILGDDGDIVENKEVFVNTMSEYVRGAFPILEPAVDLFLTRLDILLDLVKLKAIGDCHVSIPASIPVIGQ